MRPIISILVAVLTSLLPVFGREVSYAQASGYGGEYREYDADACIAGDRYIEIYGTKTPAGRKAHAVYDHYFVNAITKKPMIVESKYNTSGLTHNQTLALPQSTIPVQIDRTTSEQLGNGVRSMFMMVDPSVSQIYGYDE